MATPSPTPGLGGPAGRSFRAIGTTVSVLTVDHSAADAAEVRLAQQVRELDQACSRFRSDSESSKAQEHGGGPVFVSALLAQLVQAAIDVARLTAGAVDPTVGRALAALGYDRDFDAIGYEGPELSGKPVPAPGWERIELDGERCLLRIPEGVQLDLGSSAKAFAADRAALDLYAELGTGVLVNLGGDIAVAGPPPEGGWRVGLALDASTRPECTEPVVAIQSGGLASSGTAVRTWRRGQRRLHHIVDPRTGDVAESDWSLVTVAAGSCLVANAVSTAVIVAGGRAMEVLGRHRLPARLVGHDGTVLAVHGWPPEP